MCTKVSDIVLGALLVFSAGVTVAALFTSMTCIWVSGAGPITAPAPPPPTTRPAEPDIRAMMVKFPTC